MGVPPNGWLIRENPITMDDLGVPPLMETPKCVCVCLLFVLDQMAIKRREPSLGAQTPGLQFACGGMNKKSSRYSLFHGGSTNAIDR